jgi:flagellar FliJ protein
MGFIFRFESLLKVRKHLKEAAEIELSKALGRLNRERLQLQSLSEDLEQAGQQFETDLRNSVPSRWLRLYADFLSGIKKRIADQQDSVARCENEVIEKRRVLLEKTKEFKIIERLKEKDFQKWQDQQRLEEQKRMDEIAVLRHGRQFT